VCVLTAVRDRALSLQQILKTSSGVPTARHQDKNSHRDAP
jgi:hypothetical protein